MMTRLGLVTLFACLMCLPSLAEGDFSATEPAACFRIYDEARPLLSEDFSLRLYKSGGELRPEARRAIQASNDETRLSGTILSGGDKPVTQYTRELREQVNACDEALQIPDMAKRAEADDVTCAGRYAVMASLARSHLQRANFRGRSEKSVEIAHFIQGFLSDYPVESDASVKASGLTRANQLTNAEGELSQETLFELIFDAQACDAKYGYSPMLIPGNIHQMFGLNTE
tara:strand:+ start:4437 stop:5123 length:687 start_codon:yes stop_codon:yes gene_type:complete